MRNLLVLVALLAATNAWSATWIVNNLPGSSADFNSLNTAIETANPGDSIMLHPSGITYGSQTINKQLYILGPGHHPDFSNGVAPVTGNLTLSSPASGTFIKGIHVYGSISAISNTINIVISGCRLEGSYPINVSDPTATGWIIDGNILLPSGPSQALALAGNGINFQIRNNFIQSSWNYALSPFHPSVIFDHNIVITTNTSSSTLFNTTVSGVTISNSIFIVNSSSPSTFNSNCNNCVWEKNLTYNPVSGVAELPGINLNDVDPMFVSASPFTWSYSNDYNLAPESPCIGYGTDGTDTGIYGGNVNFSPFGYNNALPRIESVILSESSVPAGGNLSIQIIATGAGN